MEQQNYEIDTTKIIFHFPIINSPNIIVCARNSERRNYRLHLTQKHLVGANVFLQGTAIGAATNIEGEYSIKPIPEGSYTVKVSYLGYKATTCGRGN